MKSKSVFLSVIASLLTIVSYGQEDLVSIAVDSSPKTITVTEATKMAGKAVFETSCKSCHTNYC